MRNSLKFAIVFWVVNLHLLRNLATLPYLALYGLISAVVVLSFMFGVKRSRLSLSLPTLWLLIAVVGALVSSFVIPVSAALYGLSRFLFAAPIFLALVQYTDSRNDLLLHIRSVTLYFAVAALTVPLQFVVGPISWFADDSSRAGFDRYSSLVGSLASLGIVTGCYIVLMQLSPARTRFLKIAVTIVSAIASLSKSAIANVVLGMIAMTWVSRKKLSRSVVGLAIMVASIIAAVAYVPPVSERFIASLESFGYDAVPGGAENYDASVQESAADRVTKLPKENLLAMQELYSPLVYLIGGGYGMASTALVPEEASIAPMAHNQFAELGTVFGAVGGGIMIWLTLTLWMRLRRRSRGPGDIPSVVLASYSILLVNSVFANGTLYQPASASILCLAAYVALAPARHLFDEESQERPIGTGARELPSS
ncbi:hypothetical protein [Microbacterium sp.]|uniref:hypothetical protein n=1 Tax=Microbacterium sp. TaxID=51671 RepID=UPI002736522D|nr:hypothetical protein [Microbacterium sp.]MDP3950824.1 hypothetical protein [Microbacterium sp.]